MSRRSDRRGVHAEEVVTVDQATELAKNLKHALIRIKALEERLAVVEERRMDRAAATREARIGRAARRAGFQDRDAWLEHCKKIGWDDHTSVPPDDFKGKRRSLSK